MEKEKYGVFIVLGMMLGFGIAWLLSGAIYFDTKIDSEAGNLMCSRLYGCKFTKGGVSSSCIEGAIMKIKDYKCEVVKRFDKFEIDENGNPVGYTKENIDK